MHVAIQATLQHKIALALQQQQQAAMVGGLQQPVTGVVCVRLVFGVCLVCVFVCYVVVVVVTLTPHTHTSHSHLTLTPHTHTHTRSPQCRAPLVWLHLKLQLLHSCCKTWLLLVN